MSFSASMEVAERGGQQHVPQFEKNSFAFLDAGASGSPDDVWTKVKVLAQQGPVVTVRTENVMAKVLNVDLLKTEMVPANKSVVADLTSLYFMNEAAILENLEKRSYSDEPYTFMANVLVAVNPLKVVRDVSEHLGTSKAVSLVHPYSVAEQAFQELQFRANQVKPAQESEEKVSQSVVMSGESGAGKTECSKMVLRHVLFRCNSDLRGNNDLSSKLLESNEILESFGNAQTLRNHNSSRFGKFIQLWFGKTTLSGRNNYCVQRATITTYLLEKSRITRHSVGEHNFHVFYYLFQVKNKDLKRRMALEKRDFLSNAKETGPGTSALYGFNYLDPTSEDQSEFSFGKQFLPTEDGFFVEDQDLVGLGLARERDARNHEKLVTAFAAFGMDSGLVDSLFECLAGILHLGNIRFRDVFANNENFAEEDRSRFVASFSAMQKSAQLLGLDVEDLDSLLTTRKISVGNELSFVKLNASSANVARDSLARAIYSAIFEWILLRLRDSLTTNVSLTQSASVDVGFIGILDIFGFEVFEKNSFEQLLINYANEALQETFNKSIFLSELELYKREGLFKWSDNDYNQNELDVLPPDNSRCLELFQGSRRDPANDTFAAPTKLKAVENADKMAKLGLLKLLDNETWELKSSDEKFNANLHQAFDKNECFGRLHPLDRKDKFVIRQFAGAVTYEVSSFIAKNKDSVPTEMTDILVSTKNAALKLVVSVLLEKQNTGGAETVRKSVVKKKAKKKKTVASEFINQMRRLISTLESTRTSFIRCIKPNAALYRGEAETWFNRAYVAHQLRNLSIPQTVRVLSNGFPTRLNYSQLVEDFRNCLPLAQVQNWQSSSKLRNSVKQASELDINVDNLGKEQDKMFIEALFFAFEIERDVFKLGFTKVFFKSGQISKLEKVLKASAEWNQDGTASAESLDDASKLKEQVARKFKGFYVRKKLRIAFAKVFSYSVFAQILLRVRHRREQRKKFIRRKWRVAIKAVVAGNELRNIYKSVVAEAKRKEEERLRKELELKAQREREREEQRRREEEARLKLEAEREQQRLRLIQERERLEAEQRELERVAKLKAEEEEREEQERLKERARLAELERQELEKLVQAEIQKKEEQLKKDEAVPEASLQREIIVEVPNSSVLTVGEEIKNDEEREKKDEEQRKKDEERQKLLEEEKAYAEEMKRQIEFEDMRIKDLEEAWEREKRERQRQEEEEKMRAKKEKEEQDLKYRHLLDEEFAKQELAKKKKAQKVKRNMSSRQSKFNSIHSLQEKQQYLDPFKRLEALLELTEDEVLTEEQIQVRAEEAVQKLRDQNEIENEKLKKQMIFFARGKGKEYLEEMKLKMEKAREKDEKNYQRLVKVEVEKLRLRNAVNVLRAEDSLDKEIELDEEKASDEDAGSDLVGGKKLKKKVKALNNRNSETGKHASLRSHLSQKTGHLSIQASSAFANELDPLDWEYQGVEDGKRVYVNQKSGLVRYKKLVEEEEDQVGAESVTKARLKLDLMKKQKQTAADNRRRTIAKTAHNVAVDMVETNSKRNNSILSPRERDEQIREAREKILEDFANQQVEVEDEADDLGFNADLNDDEDWDDATKNKKKDLFSKMYANSKKQKWFLDAETNAKTALQVAYESKKKIAQEEEKENGGVKGNTLARTLFRNKKSKDKKQPQQKTLMRNMFGFGKKKGEEQQKQAKKRSVEEFDLDAVVEPVVATSRGGSMNIAKKRNNRRTSVIRNGLIVQRMIEAQDPVKAALKQFDEIEKLGQDGDISPEEALQLKRDLVETAQDDIENLSKKGSSVSSIVSPALRQARQSSSSNFVISSRKKRPSVKGAKTRSSIVHLQPANAAVVCKNCLQTNFSANGSSCQWCHASLNLSASSSMLELDGNAVLKRTKRDEVTEDEYYNSLDWDLQAKVVGGLLRMCLLPRETKNIFNEERGEESTFFTILCVFERENVKNSEGVGDDEVVDTRKFIEWRVLHLLSEFASFNNELRSGKYMKFLTSRQRKEMTPLAGPKQDLMNPKNFQFFGDALKIWFKNLQRAMSSDKLSREFFQVAGEFWELQAHVNKEDIVYSDSEDSWDSWG